MRCDRGLKCLRNYRKEWDEDRATFRDKPFHNWDTTFDGHIDLISALESIAGQPRWHDAVAETHAEVLEHDVDDLIDGSSLASLTDFILSLARPAPAAAARRTSTVAVPNR